MAKKSKRENLDQVILETRAKVGELATKVDGLVSRQAVPQLTNEEMSILLGELRAVRHLLDSKGEFRHLDKVGPGGRT